MNFINLYKQKACKLSFTGFSFIRYYSAVNGNKAMARARFMAAVNLR